LARGVVAPKRRTSTTGNGKASEIALCPGVVPPELYRGLVPQPICGNGTGEQMIHRKRRNRGAGGTIPGCGWKVIAGLKVRSCDSIKKTAVKLEVSSLIVKSGWVVLLTNEAFARHPLNR